MRYKIEYGKGPKLDRWGHYLPDQPKTHEIFTGTLEEAKEKALEISLEHKKWDINVYDMQGPVLKEYEEEGKFSTWCVYGFRAGSLIGENEGYFKQLKVKDRSQLLELEKGLTKAVSAMWDSKSALYEASDGYVYSLHELLDQNFLDPIRISSVVGRISNAIALDWWWWHDRDTGQSYVLFTNNRNFHFDTADDIYPLIEEKVGNYHPKVAVVYRDAETIDKIVSTLSEMLNPDNVLTKKDWCLSNLIKF